MFTAADIPGFDPSAPMQFHTSHFGVVLAVAIVVAVVLIAGAAFLLAERDSYSPTLSDRLFSAPVGIAALIGALIIAAVVVPVSPVAPDRFNACDEAAGWANARYGVSLSEANCDDLFKARQWLTIGAETHQTLLDDGREISSKKIGDQTILTDATGQELSKDVAVAAG